ncbi:cytochrome c biogenesis protein CcsA [bacterium]|nr:cytochrome c biogenesis protein CcsA [bacterium]
MDLLFWSLCGTYFVGWVFCCLSYFRVKQQVSVWGRRFLILGFCLQLIFIVTGYGELKTVLFNSLSGLLIFLSLLLILVMFILNFYFPEQIFELIFPPLTIFFLLLSILIADQPVVTQEFLERSTLMGRSLLVVHGSFSMLGYLLFGVACLTSGFFLFQEKRIKNKTLLLKKVKFPSLGLLDTIIFKMVVAGFLFLTVGLLLGINLSILTTQGAPKISLRQLLPVFTWSVYAILLISRSAIGIRGRNSAIWSMIGFLVAVISFVYEIALLMQQS